MKTLEDWLAEDLVSTSLMRVCWAAGLFAVGVWLWPTGVLDTPVSMIELGDWLWILCAIFSGGLGALMLFLIGVHVWEVKRMATRYTT
jgi:hypothetical protein